MFWRYLSELFSKLDEIKTWVTKATEQFGRIDCVLWNAGTGTGSAGIGER